MQTESVDVLLMPWNLKDRVQDASLLQTVGRDVDVLPAFDGVLAEDRVAVMAGVVNGIPTVSKVMPDLIGEVFKLSGVLPKGDFTFLPFMVAENFLQKN